MSYKPYKKYNSHNKHLLISTKTPRIFLLLGFLFFNITFSQSQGLFDSEEILQLTLQGDMKTIFKDRGEDPQYHFVNLHSEEGDTNFDIPIKVKARGNFRKDRANCKYPPLFLNFAKSTTPKTSVFSGQDKMKLVTPCQGDKFVVQEYLVYKLYNLITPQSFRARLVQVIYMDTVKGKGTDPYYGILLEEEDQMAERNNSISVEFDRLSPKETNKDVFLTMAVFEYMIGNTDWSVQYQQNVKLIITDSTSLPITVPYDFDHAGIVQAPYAHPAEELNMTSTRQRRFRGYCLEDLSALSPVFETFNQLKEEFYAIYNDNPWLNEKFIKQTIKFLDEFYETINDPKQVEKEFGYPCDESGTGNVVIKGLNKD